MRGVRLFIEQLRRSRRIAPIGTATPRQTDQNTERAMKMTLHAKPSASPPENPPAEPNDKQPG
jgi:hypothetical protein